MDRISIQWTDTAIEGLRGLPPKVRRGLIAKGDELLRVPDPSKAHKALIGPLQGYFRITYSRYRAIYTVEREKTKSGAVVQRITVIFVAVGIRNEGDKDDVYRLAQRLVRLGIIKPK